MRFSTLLPLLFAVLAGCPANAPPGLEPPRRPSSQSTDRGPVDPPPAAASGRASDDRSGETRPPVEVAQRLHGRTVWVDDGDSFQVRIGSETIRVRLYGIDAPERTQAYANKARQALRARVQDRQVSIEQRDEDVYGRIVGVAYVDGRDVNLEMLENGWAWHYKRHDQSPRYATAEAEAKAARRGLWADENPMPPWEFRRQQVEE